MELFGDNESYAVGVDIVGYNDGRPEGNIFIFINGKRFGKTDFNEDILDFFSRVVEGYKFKKKNLYLEEQAAYKKLIGLSGDKIIEFSEYLRGESESDDNVFKELAKEIDEDKLDRGVVFRAEYAFDDCYIMHVFSGDREKIVVKLCDEEVAEDIVVERGLFYKYFSDAALYIEKTFLAI